MVFVTEFIIRKVKNEDPWNDSGFVQEKEWREELEREQWTVDGKDHTRAKGRSEVVVVNKINNNESNSAHQLFLFIPSNQIMSTSINRLDPQKSVLLVCDVQLKFSGFLFYQRGSHVRW